MRQYFRLEDDLEVLDRWYLNGIADGTGTKLDSRDFTYGKPITIEPSLLLSLPHEDRLVEVQQPLTVAIRQPGRPLEFTFAEFEMPVVRRGVIDVISEFCEADFQRIPVDVGRRRDEYEILNVSKRVECIDRFRSDILWWTESDERHDKIGKPRMVNNLVIDPTRIDEVEMFRIEGWEIALVVSAQVKKALEKMQASGLVFAEV